MITTTTAINRHVNTHLGLVDGLESSSVTPQVQHLVHIAHLHCPRSSQIARDLLLLLLDQLDRLFAGRTNEWESYTMPVQDGMSAH